MQETYEGYIQLWSSSAMELVDIRRLAVRQGGRSGSYRLPAFAFVRIVVGSGLAMLDRRAYPIQAGVVLHGGKGMRLELQAQDHTSYELILYKIRPSAIGTVKDRKAAEAQMAVSYAMLQSPSIEASKRLQQLYDAFYDGGAITRILAQGLFYQQSAAWLAQLRERLIPAQSQGVADRAMQLLYDGYNENVTLSSLAGRLGCSERQLSKQFKLRWEVSPIRALTRIRMYKAACWLAESEASLQEIAVSIGYVNGFTLSRLFKDNYDMTPGQYRQQVREGTIMPDWAVDRAASDIVAYLFPTYNDNENHNHLLVQGRDTQLAIHAKAIPSTAALLLGATLLLSACGVSDTEVKPGGGDSAVAPPTSSATKTFEDALGEREIPVEAERIYSFGATNYLVALGIVPQGAPRYEVEYDYYLSHYPEKIEIVGDYPPSYEAILELEPDLIITADIDVIGNDREDYFENLSKIAPVATFEWYEQDVYGQLRQVADIVGRQEQAEQWISEHFQRAEQAKAKVSKLVGPDETVSIVWVNEKGFTLVGNRNIGHVIYTLLGLKPPQQIADEISANGGELVGIHDLSLESIPDITGDHLIVMINGNAEAAEAQFEAMMRSELWKSLPAVQAGHIYQVPYEKWWSYSLLTVDALLDDAVQLFER
ncbi:hypothetical protein PA598K_01991 [Paenibacillus sp. 598K]|uniref:AraC family transcriptional regulator n=1 Tax=Paenibacillus sp. 598K TaxID=1117987 RepID=UPI000FFAC9DC|nr:ABC transporter substrate-binding protein [Paenibacillus sp. 598K]GBF73682.1 hypothetical protein PA598K_01991 [Paenibacillus sp. 598K]